MYRRIYYDGSKIYLWETLPDGKNVKTVYDHEIEYYIPDKSRKSPIRDIFETPVLKQSTKNRQALRDLAQAGIRLYETDIAEPIKFLHK